ncbi:hypothetical protein HN803_01070 [candidate division WWE3 bacterium]|jgi:hypothetical protein|nr:hypothetical protein [candidate division WWE3 bacterium]MBT7349366.1 hypothetical protein [candidate division WWE3 bacterium]
MKLITIECPFTLNVSWLKRSVAHKFCEMGYKVSAEEVGITFVPPASLSLFFFSSIIYYRTYAVNLAHNYEVWVRYIAFFLSIFGDRYLGLLIV